MTEEDISKGIVYSEGFETLLKVPKQESIIISNKTKTIFGSTDDNYAFLESKSTLKSFSFMPNPELTTIQSFAFFNCYLLTTIDLSPCKHLTSIMDSSFSGCSSVTTLKLPKGSLTTLGSNTFSSVKADSVEIPSTVSAMSSSFRNSKIKSFVFEEPASITTFGWGTFSGSPIDSFCVPSSLETIFGSAFELTKMSTISVNSSNTHFVVVDNILYREDMKTLVYCPMLRTKDVNIPENVTTIGESSFVNSQATTVTFPSTLNEIASFAFSHALISSAHLPKSIISIGSGAFLSSKIKDLVFEEPSSLTTIGDRAFNDCKQLSSVILPSNLTKFEGAAFNDCSSTLNISFAESSPFFYDQEQSLIITKDKTTIVNYVGVKPNEQITIPSEAETIKSGCFDSKKNIVSVTFLGTSLTTIESRAFAACTGLTTLTIPSSVYSISEQAFSELSLESLSFGNVQFIGDSVFYFCRNLVSVTFESITSISSSCFRGCASLKTVTITNGVSKILENAFNGCESLTSFDFTEKISFIDKKAFQHSGITSVAIPDSAPITSISESSFYCCVNLSAISLPSKIKSIGDKAFALTAIKSLEIPLKTTKIGMSCFMQCPELESLTIPKDCPLSEISVGAFQGCLKLKTIKCENSNFLVVNYALFNSGQTELIIFPPAAPIKVFCIPPTVTAVKPSAFSCAKSLTIIAFPDDSITTIGTNAFENCTSLKMINLPSSINFIGKNAFLNCNKIICGQEINIKESLISTLLENAKFPKSGLKDCSNYCTVRARQNSHAFVNPCLYALFILFDI